jgi:hypothetical protein
VHDRERSNLARPERVHEWQRRGTGHVVPAGDRDQDEWPLRASGLPELADLLEDG